MPETPNALRDLLRHPHIWRAREKVLDGTTLSTGFPGLDRLLPGQGWPFGALTEVLYDSEGVGELQLVLPALIHLSRRGGRVAWIAPPHLPYAPALFGAGVDLAHVILIRPKRRRDVLWAAEQVLRSSACEAALIWLPDTEGQALRRLQLAAESGGGLGVLFRLSRVMGSPSPAVLRLGLEPADAGALRVRVLKCRGFRPQRPLVLGRPDAGSGMVHEQSRMHSGSIPV